MMNHRSEAQGVMAQSSPVVNRGLQASCFKPYLNEHWARGRRPPLLILCVLLLLLAFSAWGWGYKLAIKSQGAGQICLVAESKMSDIPSREVATYMAGESILLYDNPEEYTVLIVVQANPDNMMQVEIWYLDTQGEPMDEIPERLILQGTAAAVRLRHPLARLLGGVL